MVDPDEPRHASVASPQTDEAGPSDPGLLRRLRNRAAPPTRSAPEWRAAPGWSGKSLARPAVLPGKPCSTSVRLRPCAAVPAADRRHAEDGLAGLLLRDRAAVGVEVRGPARWRNVVVVPARDDVVNRHLRPRFPFGRACSIGSGLWPNAAGKSAASIVIWPSGVWSDSPLPVILIVFAGPPPRDRRPGRARSRPRPPGASAPRRGGQNEHRAVHRSSFRCRGFYTATAPAVPLHFCLTVSTQRTFGRLHRNRLANGRSAVTIRRDDGAKLPRVASDPGLVRPGTEVYRGVGGA